MNGEEARLPLSGNGRPAGCGNFPPNSPQKPPNTNRGMKLYASGISFGLRSCHSAQHIQTTQTTSAMLTIIFLAAAMMLIPALIGTSPDHTL